MDLPTRMPETISPRLLDLCIFKVALVALDVS